MLSLEQCKRRLKNAKRRALFWSGNPSYSRHRASPRRKMGGTMDEKYEMALCDVRSLERILSELTGVKRPEFNPRADFQRAFLRFMNGEQT